MYSTLLQACTQAEEPGLALYVLEVMQRNQVMVDWETVRSIVIGTNRTYLSCVSSSSESDLAWYRVSAMLVHDAAQVLPLSMAELLLLRPLNDHKVSEGYTWVRHLPDQPPPDPMAMTLRNKVFWAAISTIAQETRSASSPSEDVNTESTGPALTKREHQELLRQYVSGCLTLGNIDSATKTLWGILKPISVGALQDASAPAPVRVPSEMVPTLVNTYIRGLFFNGEWHQGLSWLEAVIKDTRSEKSGDSMYKYKELVQYTTNLLSAFFDHYPEQYTTQAGVRLKNTVLQYYQTTGEVVPSDTVTDLVRTISIVPSAHTNDSETRGAVAQQLKKLFTVLSTLKHEPIDPRALHPVTELVVQCLQDEVFEHIPVLLRGLVEECVKGIDKFSDSTQDRTKIYDLIAQAGPALISYCLRYSFEQDCWTHICDYRAAFTRLSELGDATYSPNTLHALQYTIYRLYLEVRQRSPSGFDPVTQTPRRFDARLWGSDEISPSLWTWIMGTPAPPKPPAPDLERARVTLEDFTALTKKSMTQFMPLKLDETRDDVKHSAVVSIGEPDQLAESLSCTDKPIDPPYPWLADTSGPAAVFRQLTGVLVDLDQYTVKHPGLPAVPLVNFFPSSSSALHILEESSFAALQDAPLDQLLAFDEAVRRNQVPLLQDIHELLAKVHGLAEAQLRWTMYLYQAGLWALRCRARVPANVKRFEKGYIQLEQHMVTTLARVGRPDLALLHYRRLLAQRASVNQSTYLQFIEHVPKEKIWLPMVQHLFRRSLDNYPLFDSLRTRLFLSWFGTDMRIVHRAMNMNGIDHGEVLQATMQAALWQKDVDAGLQIYEEHLQSVAQQPRDRVSFMDTALLQLTWKRRPEKAQSLVQAVRAQRNIDLNGTDTATVAFNRFALRVQDPNPPNLMLTHTYVPDLILQLGIDQNDCGAAEQLYKSIPDRYGVPHPSWQDTNALMQVFDCHAVPVKEVVQLFRSALAHGIVPPSDASTAAHIIKLVTRIRSSNRPDEGEDAKDKVDKMNSPLLVRKEQDASHSPVFDHDGNALASWVFRQMRPKVSRTEEESELMQDAMLAYASGTLRSPPSNLQYPSKPWAHTFLTTEVDYAANGVEFEYTKELGDRFHQLFDNDKGSSLGFDLRIPGIDLMDHNPVPSTFNPKYVADDLVDRVLSPSHKYVQQEQEQ